MQLIIIVLAIGLQIFLTYKKVSPFLSLLIVALLAGLAFGMEPGVLLHAVKTGVGSTLGDVLLIICLGAILGKILELSGAATQIANTLIHSFGKKNIQWAVLLTGFFVGIPLFYNAGFIILVPLIFSIARNAGLPLLYVAIPMAASLSTTHCFLPPHPGPMFLVGAFNADLGKTLIYGLVISIPVVIIAGPLLGRVLKKINVEIPGQVKIETEAKKLPARFESFILAMLPVILIALAVIANTFFPGESIIKKVILFFGDATIALLTSVLLAVLVLGVMKGKSMQQVMGWLNESVAGVAVILLIITAGGVFKQVLIDSGTAAYITSFSKEWNINPLLFAWIITALLRIAIGSATVAGITAAGIVSPLLATGTVSPELLVLAVGTGSVFCSHINDSGFWIFKEFFNLSLKQTFLSWTVMETIISILGLVGVMVLSLFIK
ncbi:MAG TPA: gluconate:H+ symporter [Chitinophagaceae bacterium]|nr:gluconate:H+ symporter [Chitinophagaceae bacterium]